MSTKNPVFEPGAKVRSRRLGLGTVELDKDLTAIVRFEHGIEECEKVELEAVLSPIESILRRQWDVPLKVINRIQAEAIHSFNDAWGVFSRSRIELLPHQLWVCRKVNEKWPARWLIADDMGLGKTIEAGMILWPLLVRGTVRRLLVICPARLVEQWQYRMRTIFDIRLAQYAPGTDTDKSDFWGTHPYVVASMHTLRSDRQGRQRRMLEADPWNIIMVDEAHHLNADEEQGPTLSYRLVKQLQDNGKVESIIFFTGTPHRGKKFGFLALLHLLRPDLFDPKKPLYEQLPALPQVMIRNNKMAVTDLKGRPLFRKPQVYSETYTFSPQEDQFYKLLSKFIVDGQAYASGLDATHGRAVMLVLVAIQKLASSSTAAIRQAIQKRIDRVQKSRKKLTNLQQDYLEAELTGSHDEMSRLEEKIIEESSKLQLIKNEVPRLRELLSTANEVQRETKIEKLLNILDQRFSNRSVLFFTEYKATQALLMSALMQQFGEDSVTFINGDDRIEDVKFPDGRVESISLRREIASEWFNAGKVRFLISTEAGGEGIDLQENCHTLVHVDLPWNPMRLHQRVGRLNRYGQKQRVEVLILHNPDTVESLIWEKLNSKLNQISLAFSQVMDEPEDLLQLVLGMTSPSMFRNLFAGAQEVSPDSLSKWFDQQTAQFGGRDAVEMVKELVGSAAKFNFQDVSEKIPKVDLPDLRPFLEIALTLNGRRPRDENDGFSFLTPDVWKSQPGVFPEYRGMRFDRQDRSSEAAKRLLGVGHKIVDQAIAQARNLKATVASLPPEILNEPLIVFMVRDRITEAEKYASGILAGIEIDRNTSRFNLLMDWQVIQRLNALPFRKAVMRQISNRSADSASILNAISKAEAALESRITELDLRFRYPYWEVSGILWPLN